MNARVSVYLSSIIYLSPSSKRMFKSPEQSPNERIFHIFRPTSSEKQVVYIALGASESNSCDYVEKEQYSHYLFSWIYLERSNPLLERQYQELAEGLKSQPHL